MVTFQITGVMYEGLLDPAIYCYTCGRLMVLGEGARTYQGEIKASEWGRGCMLIIMVSLTCGLLLEVRRSWEKRGEKAKTESSKSISHFRNHISSRHDSSLPRAFLKYKHAGINLKHWYVFGIGLVCTMQNFIFYKNLIDDSIALSAQKNLKNTILNQKNYIKFIWR